MNKKEAYLTVYEDLIKCPLYVGIYDATNGNEHFIYGISSIMDYISMKAGKLDEYEKLWTKNMKESEERSERIIETKNKK